MAGRGRRGKLTPVAHMEGWHSPRLGIRFQKGKDADVGLFYPDGRKLLSFLELGRRAERLAAKAA